MTKEGHVPKESIQVRAPVEGEREREREREREKEKEKERDREREKEGAAILDNHGT